MFSYIKIPQCRQEAETFLCKWESGTYFECETTVVYNGAETALYIRSQIHSWARFLHASADLHQVPKDFSGTKLGPCAHMVLCRALNLIWFLRKLYYIHEKMYYTLVKDLCHLWLLCVSGPVSVSIACFTEHVTVILFFCLLRGSTKKYLVSANSISWLTEAES